MFSFGHFVRVHAANFNAVQLSIVSVCSQLVYEPGHPSSAFRFTIVVAALQGLFEWRDLIARADDESTGYVLPNKTLLDIGIYFYFPIFRFLEIFRWFPTWPNLFY